MASIPRRKGLGSGITPQTANQIVNPNSISGQPVWGGRGQIGAPGPAPTAAATPAAPAAPAPIPQPFDPNYQAYVLGAQRNVALGGNEATWQQQNLGYNLGINPDGTLNTANPYSQAQLLQDSYHNAQRGTTNSLAARGQLYSGAMTNAQGINDRNYSTNYAALQQKALQGYHGIQSGQLGTYANNSAGVSNADFNSLLKAAYPGSS